MHITPIRTRRLQTPQDDLFEAISESDLKLQEKDVVIVSSKVVAINEGRCIPISEAIDKEELVKKEADVYIKKPDSRWRITVKNNTFISSAGVDESNADEHYILLPKDSHKSAQEIWHFLKERYVVGELGVIIVDSHSGPFRYGSLGVGIGWHGFEPVAYYTGTPDLFGRPAQFTRINTVDSLAAAGVFVVGELAEQTPLAVISGAPHMQFTDRDTSSELFIPHREDIYWPLLKGLFED